MPGATLWQVAEDLGNSDGLLGRWKRDLGKHEDKAFVGHISLSRRLNYPSTWCLTRVNAGLVQNCCWLPNNES